MGRRIHVTGVRKEEPNWHLYVLALIALARQLPEADAPTTVAADPASEPEAHEAEQSSDEAQR